MNGTKSQISVQHWLLLAVLILFVSALAASAQVTSSTSTSAGQATTQTEVRRGEVVYVSGDELVVRMEDGTVKHITVPDSARATVDGKELSVHELQPGMKLEKTITTTTTPKVVKTVTQAKGKVFHVSGDNVIVSYPDGTNKQYKVPPGTKFTIDGQEKTVHDLKKGMTISATVVKEVPETEVSTASNVSGTAPPPPTPPVTAEAPLVIEQPAPAPVQQAAATPPEQSKAELPNTGTELPLIGLVGFLSLAFGFGAGVISKLKR
jgi:hypothetical protein